MYNNNYNTYTKNNNNHNHYHNEIDVSAIQMRLRESCTSEAQVFPHHPAHFPRLSTLHLQLQLPKPHFCLTYGMFCIYGLPPPPHLSHCPSLSCAARSRAACGETSGLLFLAFFSVFQSIFLDLWSHARLSFHLCTKSGLNIINQPPHPHFPTHSYIETG
jgi:hypothetical protein